MMREKEHGSLKTLWSYHLSFALADLWVFFFFFIGEIKDIQGIVVVIHSHP